MKKFLLLLLFSAAAFAQPEVFNVQRYDVDEKPFATNKFDISGNEYSFVFLDKDKKEVVFFFTNMKLKYSIVDTYPDKSRPDYDVYLLDDGFNTVEMKINAPKTKIEFLYPDTHIFLKVGKSTKSRNLKLF